MGRNASNGLIRVGLFATAVGSIGLLAWLAVRGLSWLKGELAYQRWRRDRFQRVVLPTPETGEPQRVASGRALVWDDHMRETQP